MIRVSNRISSQTITIVVIGLVAAVVYALTAAPTFYWLDSSEFVAATWGLGVAHPPGHPLALLVARLFCLLPFGTIAFRVNLASAIQAGIAISFVACITRQLIQRFETEDAAPSAARTWLQCCAMVLAALSAAFSFAVWFQAVRAEVYMLNLMLVLAAVNGLLVWERTRDGRYLLVAAFLLGLGLCNHHLLIVVALPGIAAFVLFVQRREGLRRTLVASCCVGALGLSTIAYLPLRARTSPEVNWGAATTLDRLYWVVSAQVFQKSVDRAATQSITDRGFGAVAAMMTNLTPWGALFALGGLYLLLRKRPGRAAALLFGGVIAGNLLTPLLIGFDPFNADAHGYLAVSVAVLASSLGLLIWVLLHSAWQRRQRVATVCIAVVALTLPFAQFWKQVESTNLRDHWAAEDTAREILDRPAGSLVLSGYFETTFNAWALHAVHDFRPDITVFDWHFLTLRAYATELLRRSPELSPIVTLHDDVGRLNWPALGTETMRRPVFMEYDDDLPDFVISHLKAAGRLLELTLPQSDAMPTPPNRYQTVVHPRHALDNGADLETRRAQTFSHYRLASFACRKRDHKLFQEHISEALLLAPQDRKIQELKQQCFR